MNILLVCQAGMSTSLLVNRMLAESEKQGMDHHIQAVPADELEHHIDKYDVVLIGPQIRYKEKQITAVTAPKNKGCAVIDAVSYGLVDGKKVLAQALALKK